MTAELVPPLVTPGRGGGLLEVVRRRYLLRLVVRRELRRRYQGSLLGLGWSYVRPAVNFAVYFFVVGIFLRMAKAIVDFPVYLF
jgi:ABC-2 type transport system permease protein